MPRTYVNETLGYLFIDKSKIPPDKFKFKFIPDLKMLIFMYTCYMKNVMF